jgi:hypothetical protein
MYIDAACINKLLYMYITCTSHVHVSHHFLINFGIKSVIKCITKCMYMYLLKVSSFDVGIFHLSEVGKAIVVTRVRLAGGK